MVVIDCLLVFDVVLFDLILGKGEMFCQVFNFWFVKIVYLMFNYLIGIEVVSVLFEGVDLVLYVKCVVVICKLKLVLVEVIVRGYLIGSGWKDYQCIGKVSGIDLFDGLCQVEQLFELIFIFLIKVVVGDYDENIDFDVMVKQVGVELVEWVCDVILCIYKFVVDYVCECGIILVDIKFEFGIDVDGWLYIMDEMLMLDLLCYWLVDEYEVGISLLSYDKQFVCDYLEMLDWGKIVLGLNILVDIIECICVKYVEVLQCLVGISVD